MAISDKVKFFWQTMLGSAGSTLTATSTAAGYSVNNIYNMLEIYKWKAANANDPCDLSFDAGAAKAYSVDYLAMAGHNLGTVGGYAVLSQSSDGVTYYPVIVTRRTDNKSFAAEAKIIPNDDFEVWAEGTAVAPTGFEVHGFAWGSVARESVIVNKEFSMKLTRAGANGGYKRVIAPYALTQMKGMQMSFGCYVYCATANTARLTVSGTVLGTVSSSYHSGSGAWEWLTVTVTVPSNETSFSVICDMMNNDVLAYFDVLRGKNGTSVTSDDVTDYLAAGAISNRYWRLRFTGHAAAPEVAICIWGNKTEIKRALLFDPYEEEIKANVVKGPTGYVLGVHNQYRERRMDLRFNNVDSATYQKLKAWWDGSGLRNFFVAPDRRNYPDDVFLMMPDPRFRNPFIHGGTRREVNLTLTGRREDI